MKHFILAICAMFGVAVLATQPASAATSMDSHNVFEIYDDTGSGSSGDGDTGESDVDQGGATGTGDGQTDDDTGTGQQTTTDKATPSNVATRAAHSQSGTGTQQMGIGSWINDKTGGRLPALNGLSDFWLMILGIEMMIIVALGIALTWQRRRVRVTVESNE